MKPIYFLVCLQDREIADVIPVHYTPPEKAVLASVFNLSEHPVITAFKQDAVSDIDIDNKEVQLKPKMLSNEFHVADLTEFEHIPDDYHLEIRHGNKLYFLNLHNKGKVNNFMIKGNIIYNEFRGYQRAREIALGVTLTGQAYIHSSFRGMSKGYAQFSWKLIRVFQVNEDPNKQLYLIASVNCPAMFLTSATEFISLGDPGELGYWYLDKSGVVRAGVR